MRLKIRKKGFTLVELLVVIAIIGLLATLLLVNINAARGRARDAQRKSDLRNLQTALRLYFNDYGIYPVSSGGQIMGCDAGGTELCEWGTDFITDQQTYMSVLPGDPSPDRSYTYTRGAITDDYTLEACLENTGDDRCQGACSGGLDGCLYLVKP